MEHFTSENPMPSKRTIDIIKAIDYTYRVMNINGSMKSYCLN